MKAFQWDSHYLTGIPSVDEQHHRLVDIINRYSNLLTADELDLENIESVFSELADYAKYHFTEEERLMENAGINRRHMDLHFNEHDHFLQEVSALHNSVSPEDTEATKSLLKFLTFWLAYHILGSDQNMATQISAIESGKKAGEAYNEEEKKHSKSTEPLLQALHGLFQQVSERNRQLLEINQTLEQKVEERTRELADANIHLEQLALTDVLTNLPNRRYAMQQLRVLWQESTEDELPLSCMMIDADGFKTINDTYGHDAGDVVLQVLSRTLQEAVRTDDIVCRLGGDEFLIICPNTPHDGAMYLAENTRKEIDALRVPAGGGEWKGSISVGVASHKDGMEKPDELIKAADEGVYLSKEAGRNCVRSID
ncbi:MAG: bacteriohemerythrin [Candidatus Sedimenticola sp. 20ELBAFRAG]